MWIDMYDVLNCTIDTVSVLYSIKLYWTQFFFHVNMCNSSAQSENEEQPMSYFKNDIDELLILETEKLEINNIISNDS